MLFRSDGLTPGTYVVTLDTCQTAVGQRALTTPNVGSDDTRDSDFDAAPSPCGESSVTVNVPCWTCGPIEGKTDGGFRAPGATIGELLWLDENNDGIRDPNEPPVRGVTVGVCNATTGEVLGSAVTDAAGRFAVANRFDGSPFDANTLYNVCIDPNQPALAGITLTTPKQGNDPTRDSDGERDPNGMIVAPVTTPPLGQLAAPPVHVGDRKSTR